MFASNHLIGFGAFSAGFAGASAAVITLPSGDNAYNGFTIRTVLASSAFSNYGSFSRFTWQGGSGAGINITKAYIGPLSSTYGFSTAPTQILFAGSSGINIPTVSQDGISDIMPFSIDPATSYVVAFYMAGVPASGASQTSLPTGWTQYYKSGDDAATTSPSGYTTDTKIVGLKRIEV